MNAIGERIKQQRKRKDLTQPQIKELTGISSGTLSDIENGKTLPAALSLIKLSKALECSIDWMLTGESLQQEDPAFLAPLEEELLTGFRELSEDDKEEMISILQMKRRKTQAAKIGSDTANDEISHLVG
ncbi:helix-turn-helix domain-containing protein [Lachnospiraceae bacterium JLR.KK008]